MTITVSIVLYHNDPTEIQEAAKSCLVSESVKKIYLIDYSANNSLQSISDDSRIIYIHNRANLGFGAAHNIALRKILNNSDYHLVLNPDITFSKGVIEALATFMNEHPDVGLAMPKVLYRNGEVQRLCKLLPNPFQLFGRRFLGNTFFAKRLDRSYELHDYAYDRPLDVPNLSGCFMFVRTKLLTDIGFFDERYFMYLEDIDLVRRIGQLSRTVVYPYVAVYHGYHQGSYHNRRLMLIHIRSAIKYFNKWGWFFDKERKHLNATIKARLKPDDK